MKVITEVYRLFESGKIRVWKHYYNNEFEADKLKCIRGMFSILSTMTRVEEKGVREYGYGEIIVEAEVSGRLEEYLVRRREQYGQDLRKRFRK